MSAAIILSIALLLATVYVAVSRGLVSGLFGIGSDEPSTVQPKNPELTGGGSHDTPQSAPEEPQADGQGVEPQGGNPAAPITDESGLSQPLSP
jgi:hypothetical protein